MSFTICTSRHGASCCADLISSITAFFYLYSYSTITAPFPSPFVATISKPSLLYLGFLSWL